MCFALNKIFNKRVQKTFRNMMISVFFKNNLKWPSVLEWDKATKTTKHHRLQTSNSLLILGSGNAATDVCDVK